MKRSLFIITAVAIGISLVSCTLLDEILSVNPFAESMEFGASDVTPSNISGLLEKSRSDSFFEILKTDKTGLKSLVLTTVDNILLSSTDPVELQEAAILGADVIIYTSPAGDLLANAANIIDGLPTDATMEDVLDLIMPASVYDGDAIDETNFGLMIEALMEANTYYLDIGDNMNSEGEYVTSAANPGDIALAAFISASLQEIVVPLEYSDDLGAYLFDALTPGSGVDSPLFESPDITTPDYYLTNIVNAAGLGDLLTL